MNVLILSPGYPADMPEFTRGLAECGARVFGVGDQPVSALPDFVRRSLSEYIQVRSLWDSKAVISDLHVRLRGNELDRIECLWEPGIMLAAELRKHFGVEGLTIEQAHRFREITVRCNRFGPVNLALDADQVLNTELVQLRGLRFEGVQEARR